ncbi:MAG TPA: isochorismatase family protein [Magnetospirillaceae bacterium]|nr:isochorismatase family protein [Magnetospirillaceae bacterium]
MVLTRDRSCLLIVDVQERQTPVMSDPRRVLQNCGLLMRAATRLGIPLIVTELHPRELGPTMVDLRPYIPEEGALAKQPFSAAADPEILARLQGCGREQVVIAGIETHIAVLQTALDLSEKGFKPMVVADACGSRRIESEQMAWSRMRQCGIELLSFEMALFEWLSEPGTPEFKELAPLAQ